MYVQIREGGAPNEAVTWWLAVPTDDAAHAIAEAVQFHFGPGAQFTPDAAGDGRVGRIVTADDVLTWRVRIDVG